MLRNRFILLLLVWAGFTLTTCIKPYQPEIKTSEQNKLVVTGSVTNQEGYQRITVSRVSSINDPKFIPVNNCVVVVSDNQGNSFTAQQTGPGAYDVWMSQTDLVPGRSYRVEVLFNDGTSIISAYDQMPQVPAVDSLYYLRKDVPTTDPGNPLKGIQFYVDYYGGDNYSPFVMWELEETYEYHTVYPITVYFDGSFHTVDPPDYSKMVCWKTNHLNEIFTLSTAHVSNNQYKAFPLNYVDNRSQRLAYGYSLLVKQTGLSEAAYNYWDKVRINQGNSNGMFLQQPFSVKGNLSDANDPGREVLGFFSAVSVKSKRIFVRPVPGLELDYDTFCSGPQKIELGWNDVADYPIYFTYVGTSLKILDNTCVDCLLMSGINVKPDFWP